MKKIIGIISIGALLVFGGCANGSKKAEPKVNMEQGKQLYESSCKACHGAHGEGNAQLKSPRLANLDSDYLLRQITNFRLGIRGNSAADTAGSQMAAIAKTITDTLAIRNVIAFIDSLPQSNITEKLLGNAKAGERTYQELCGACHGPHGKGNPKLNAPQLNGLDAWYLKSQFEKFKNGLRGSHAKDKFGSQMTSIAQSMKDGQSIEDVIAYLRSELPETK